jgi:hypothetical protein
MCVLRRLAALVLLAESVVLSLYAFAYFVDIVWLYGEGPWVEADNTDLYGIPSVVDFIAVVIVPATVAIACLLAARGQSQTWRCPPAAAVLMAVAHFMFAVNAIAHTMLVNEDTSPGFTARIVVMSIAIAVFGAFCALPVVQARGNRGLNDSSQA